MNMLLTRALRAALLDGRVYDEVREVSQPVLQALIIVLAAAIAFGLGIRSLPIQGFEDPEGLLSFLGAENMVMLVAINTMVLGWLVWGAVAWFLGSGVLGGSAGFRSILGSIGLAYAPGVLLILAPLPLFIGPTIEGVTRLWLLASVLVAFRHTQETSWWKALIPAIIGWLLAIWILPGLFLLAA